MVAPRYPAGISVREAVSRFGDFWAVAYYGLGPDKWRGMFADDGDYTVMEWCSIAIADDGRRVSMSDRARVGL